MNVAIVYEHQTTGEIAVSTIEGSYRFSHDSEWKHIGSLDALAYIQNLLREYPALVRKMKGEV